MQAVKVNDFDSTCFDASVSAGHFSNTESVEYAAIPDIYKGVIRVTSVARKHSSNYINLEFVDHTKNVRIASFTNTDPNKAKKEAEAALVEDQVEDENDIDWWQDID